MRKWLVVAVLRGRAATLFLLIFWAGLLGYAVYFVAAPVAQADREGRDHRSILLIGTGILGVGAWFLSWRRPASRVLDWLAVLAPGYAAVQLLPLPVAILRVLSPERAQLAGALAPLGLHSASAPLSVAPGLTLIHCLLLASYAVLFFAVREIARANSDAPWLPVFALLAIAGWQAQWGLTQAFAEGPEPYAHAAFPIRNHFAGFLEMCLPLAVAYGFGAVSQQYRQVRLTDALRACFGFAAAALIFAAILYSLSRMGMFAAIGSLSFLGALALMRRLRGFRRWSAVAALCAVILAGFIFEAPPQLVERFSEVSPDERVPAWRDTLHVIAAYPVFGCGLGGYTAAFEKHKSSGFTLTQDYAHNDYLQYLAEMGIAGFSILALFLGIVLRDAVRTALDNSDSSIRWLGLGCAGSLAAILIHSIADFNLYVPANAALLASICGLAEGSSKSPEGG